MSDNDDSLVTVGSFIDALQAHLARGRLEAEGLHPVIAHEHHVWADWLISTALGGVKVQVPRAEAEAAREVLEQLAQGAYALDETTVDEPHCPRCGSRQVSRPRGRWKLAFVGLMFFKLPLPFRTDTLRCEDCGYRWQPVATEEEPRDDAGGPRE